MAIGSPTSIGATVLGYPRIGRKRELEKALEALWSGAIDGAEFDQVAASVRRDAVATMAGFDARRYFAMARGTDAIAPLEMTKWFDTNYHYLVPEIGPRTEFVANAGKPLQEFAEASADPLSARSVLIGPWTFLSLAKAAPKSPDRFTPRDRLDDVLVVYAQVLRDCTWPAPNGSSWTSRRPRATSRRWKPSSCAMPTTCWPLPRTARGSLCPATSPSRWKAFGHSPAPRWTPLASI